MTGHRPDPFEALAETPADIDTNVAPDPTFVDDLRARLVTALDLDSTRMIDRPERKSTMSTTGAPIATATIVPYLCVHDGEAALRFYADAYGASEVMRVEGDDGRLGHAEFVIGGTSFYLSDEYPEMGVVSPQTLGGTAVALHLTVTDVDSVFARAVEAGATPVTEPADQPHGSRHGTLLDPFGHRWMLSQTLEDLDVATYRERAADGGFTVTTPGPRPAGQIWAAMPYADAPAGIRFLTDVLGFEEQIVVPNDDDPSIIEHSQLRWPEGGVLQAATVNRPGNPYSQRPTGSESLYVVTADPDAVWERCRAAGVEVVAGPSHPAYAPDTTNFSIRDPEGNIFTFGSYAGE